MQIYFVKATYTNNFYKLSDFYLTGEYKLVATKMLNINFKPDDGLTSFITREITLPDATSIRDHTHIIIPDYDKIYRISSIDYMNVDQYMVVLDEDPLIANYETLKSVDIILNRSNDSDLFRGVNDVADLTLKETVSTYVMPSTWKTGKWALLFFVFNPDDAYLGLKFDTQSAGFEISATLTTLRASYPEVSTTAPEKYEYFQKCVYVTAELGIYQCVWNNAGAGSLKWVEYTYVTDAIHYFKLNAFAGGSKISKTDVITICLALPFETDLLSSATGNRPLLSYDRFIGPVDTSLIDIKIVNDLVFNKSTITYSLTGEVMTKTVTFTPGTAYTSQTVEEDDGTDTGSGFDIVTIMSFKNDIDITYEFWTEDPNPLHAEPFYKYDLYVYGKKFPIPYYMMDDVHLLIAMNSGVVNYLIYYNDKRNIIGSGSFTHSIKYQIDQLDAFYSQNPTYKDQFFTKMATDSIKTIVGGAVAGSVVPGLGTVAGGVMGLGASAVDAGLSLINLGFQEKSLRMKPDQTFGENSEVSLQVINIFGIYWVMRTSENADLMGTEFGLRGFPTCAIISIAELDYKTTAFGSSKVIYGELKNVIKSEYVTSYINQKLKEGIVIFA